MILMFTEQGISITFIFHVTSFFFFCLFHTCPSSIPLFCQQKNTKKKKVTVGAELLNHDEICWNIFIKSFH